MSRRAWVASAAAAGSLIIAASAWGFYSLYECGDWQGKHFTIQERIDGCTAIISSGGYASAFAYNNRGITYRRKGDLDLAMADYDHAIGLNPKIAAYHINRGELWSIKEHTDRAIADFDDAIQLDPKSALAYDDRGWAYVVKGELDRAIADYTEAAQIDPLPERSRANLYSDRGSVYLLKGDLDRAIADFDDAIRLDPENSTTYFRRGRANLYSGTLPEAMSDLDRASELEPKNAYTALWLDIVNKRSNQPSRLVEVTNQIDMTKWPAPVIRLYLGQLTPAAALAAADDPDAKTRKEQVCEANFYTAELSLQQSKKAGAERLFDLAAADCPRSFIEYEGATAELKALTASR